MECKWVKRLQAAEILDCSTRSVDRLVARGLLTKVATIGGPRILKSSIASYQELLIAEAGNGAVRSGNHSATVDGDGRLRIPALEAKPRLQVAHA